MMHQNTCLQPDDKSARSRRVTLSDWRNAPLIPRPNIASAKVAQLFKRYTPTLPISQRVAVGAQVALSARGDPRSLCSGAAFLPLTRLSYWYSWQNILKRTTPSVESVFSHNILKWMIYWLAYRFQNRAHASPVVKTRCKILWENHWHHCHHWRVLGGPRLPSCHSLAVLRVGRRHCSAGTVSAKSGMSPSRDHPFDRCVSPWLLFFVLAPSRYLSTAVLRLSVESAAFTYTVCRAPLMRHKPSLAIVLRWAL